MQSDDVQVAVAADVSIRIVGVTGRSGRSPCTVGLKFVVPKSAVAGVVGPNGRIGLSTDASQIRELDRKSVV